MSKKIWILLFLLAIQQLLPALSPLPAAEGGVLDLSGEEIGTKLFQLNG